MNVAHITCGFDFKYASKNTGNVDTISSQNYFDVSVIASVNSKNEKISSSRIETLIQSGKMDLANELLGYMYSIEGVIEHGFKRGKDTLEVSNRKSWGKSRLFNAFQWCLCRLCICG